MSHLDSRNRARRIAIGVAVVVTAAVVGSLVLLALGVVAVWAGRVALRRRRTSRIAAVRRRSLPAALDLLVIAVHAGLTPHQAVAVVAEYGPDALRPTFATIVRRTAHGEPLADAIHVLRADVGPPAVAAVDALAMAQRHGAPLRDAIAVIASEATRERRAQSQAAARRLPVLLSFPLVVCVLPAFVLLAVAPAVIAALSSFDTPTW